jgi:hypothetical protein
MLVGYGCVPIQAFSYQPSAFSFFRAVRDASGSRTTKMKADS